jgi:phosphatidylserine/phosphatidylglycerophosphate/cardiolipin synthase-like enzyme
VTPSARFAVANDRIREHAERLTAGPVERGALALAFTESRADSVEVHVEGRNFYPPMLEDIASASSSVHINQFGFKPGVVGEAFAEALVDQSWRSISEQVASAFDEQFSALAEVASRPGQAVDGTKARAKAAAFAAISPLL